MVLDFKDAFKQLRVAHQERHYLAGECPAKGIFAYTRIMFGIASGPHDMGKSRGAVNDMFHNLYRTMSLSLWPALWTILS